MCIAAQCQHSAPSSPLLRRSDIMHKRILTGMMLHETSRTDAATSKENFKEERKKTKGERNKCAACNDQTGDAGMLSDRVHTGRGEHRETLSERGAL